MAAFYIRRQNELYHHGIKGQKWNVRRYQNEDGSYTPEGRIHYGIGEITKQKLSNYVQNRGYKIARNYIKAKDHQDTANRVYNKLSKIKNPDDNDKKIVEQELNKSSPDYDKLEKIANKYTSSKYPISDADYNYGIKYYKGPGKYSVPKYTNLIKDSRKAAKQKVEGIIKFDAFKRSNNQSKRWPAYSSFKNFDGKETLIYHFNDKKGNIVLSYSNVPQFGNTFVVGNGNIKDIDLDREFYPETIADLKKRGIIN